MTRTGLVMAWTDGLSEVGLPASCSQLMPRKKRSSRFGPSRPSYRFGSCWLPASSWACLVVLQRTSSATAFRAAGFAFEQVCVQPGDNDVDPGRQTQCDGLRRGERSVLDARVRGQPWVHGSGQKGLAGH